MKLKFFVQKGVFAVAKVKKSPASYFAVIKDGNEITAVCDQSKSLKNVIKIEKDWKIITFDMVLPFSLVGFMSKISTALADEKISIFALSAFSTDHVLVKSKDLAKAVKKLKSVKLS